MYVILVSANSKGNGPSPFTHSPKIKQEEINDPSTVSQ